MQNLSELAKTAGTIARTYINLMKMWIVISFQLTMDSAEDFLQQMKKATFL